MTRRLPWAEKWVGSLRLPMAGAMALAVLSSMASLVSACGGGERTVVDVQDAGGGETSGACAERSDCDALGGRWKGMVCGAYGRCEHCVSDGQCGLKEKCDEATALCAFREGYGDDCSLNDQCPGGGFCVQGLCRSPLDVAFCVDGACLAEGQRCNGANGVCEADLGCLGDGDCAAGELCNVPTRTCVARCDGENWRKVCQAGQVCMVDRCSGCASEDDCALGMTCDRDALSCVSESPWVRCARDEDCARGATCDPGLKVCLPKRPACSGDEECPDGRRCDAASGTCVAGSCQPDRFEPNDGFSQTLASARDLAAGTYQSLTLCGDDVDYYSVMLSRGDALSVALVADTLQDGRVSLQVIDPMERVLGRGSLSATGVAVMDGRHAVRVEAKDAWMAYGLSVDIGAGTPCDFDRLEPNDDADHATALVEEGTLSGLTVCGEDQDWFLVRPPEGMSAAMAVAAASGIGAVDVELVSRSAEGWLFRAASPLARAAATYSVEVAFAPLASGDGGKSGSGRADEPDDAVADGDGGQAVDGAGGIP